MDELMKIFKGILAIIAVFAVPAVAFPLWERMTKNPLIECQKYVEDWKLSETINLNNQTAQLRDENRVKLNDMYCDQGTPLVPTSDEIHLYCRKYSEQIDRQHNQGVSRINSNYYNKLQVCSSKN